MNAKERRKNIFEKYGGRCAYCGEYITLKTMEVDHIIPLHLGRMNLISPKRLEEMDNKNPACKPCNRWKSTFSLDQFREELELQVKRLRRDSASFRMAERYNQTRETSKTGRVKFYFEDSQ